MERRRLGKTELEVTALGFGAGLVGLRDLSHAEGEKLLKGALDLGMNVIDTAAVYGDSEERIGRCLAERRDDFVLVTKCGHQYHPGDPPGWTPENVRHSLERSLRRLRTDHVDILLLHSCRKPKLRNPGLFEALYQCKADGLAKNIGYSGDQKHLQAALDLGDLDCIEMSVNIADQQCIETVLPHTQAADIGVIGKRTIANTSWNQIGLPGAHQMAFIGPYVKRLEEMKINPELVGFDGNMVEMALRFAVFQPGVAVSLVGGINFEHMRENVATLGKGPLPQQIVQKIRSTWTQHDDGTWIGLM